MPAYAWCSQMDIQSPSFSEDEGLIATMAPLSEALALILKFSGTNIALSDWKVRSESAAHLYQVPAKLLPDFFQFLGGDARQGILGQPDMEKSNLTGPENYRCSNTSDHPIHTVDMISIRKHNLPPALCQEVKDLTQSGVV